MYLALCLRTVTFPWSRGAMHRDTCYVRQDAVGVAQKAHIVIFATKPNDIGDAVKAVASVATAQHTLISIAAGVDLGTLEGELHASAAVPVSVAAHLRLTVERRLLALRPQTALPIVARYVLALPSTSLLAYWQGSRARRSASCASCQT
jgi:hypothetical protein